MRWSRLPSSSKHPTELIHPKPETHHHHRTPSSHHPLPKPIPAYPYPEKPYIHTKIPPLHSLRSTLKFMNSPHPSYNINLPFPEKNPTHPYYLLKKPCPLIFRLRDPPPSTSTPSTPSTQAGESNVNVQTPKNWKKARLGYLCVKICIHVSMNE